MVDHPRRRSAMDPAFLNPFFLAFFPALMALSASLDMLTMTIPHPNMGRRGRLTPGPAFFAQTHPASGGAGDRVGSDSGAFQSRWSAAAASNCIGFHLFARSRYRQKMSTSIPFSTRPYKLPQR